VCLSLTVLIKTWCSSSNREILERKRYESGREGITMRIREVEDVIGRCRWSLSSSLCSPVTTASEAQWRVAVGFPLLQCLPLDQTRVRTLGNSGGSEPRALCHGPHLSFMALHDRGAPAIYLGWASPITTRSRARLAQPWPTGRDQTNNIYYIRQGDG
jgi:hypothetical protein